MKPLASDERGGIYVEVIVAILPLLSFIFGILQLTQLYTAKMALDHAASNAARSAAVVFADDPKHYAGGGQSADGQQRAVRTAAARALAPMILDGGIRTVDVRFPQGVPKQRGAEIVAEVHATYRCSVPLVFRVICPNGGTRELISRGAFASNAADFVY